MNALVLLMGLLVLSYIGSFLVGGRAIRGFGLPSGSEYVALGILLGPIALGVVERSMLQTFEPIAHVALGWLAFTMGLGFGTHRGRRVRPSRLLSATALSLACGAAIFAAVYFVLARAPGVTLSPLDRLLVAGGIGAAGAETTRHAVRWVVERHQAAGELSTLVGDLAEADSLIPLVAVAVVFSFVPAEHALSIEIPQPGWLALTVALGVVCGIIATVLLGREFRIDESWGVLLGMGLLATGTAARLGLSPLSVMFFFGLTLSTLSRHRREIVEMVGPSERPVLLPALLLAGARVDPFASAALLLWVTPAALAARVIMKVFSGSMLRAFGSSGKAARGSLLGLGLLSSGALSMSIGLGFALRFPGPVGDLVLVTAAVFTIFGEFVGPLSLRAALAGAGEIAERNPTLEVPAYVPHDSATVIGVGPRRSDSVLRARRS